MLSKMCFASVSDNIITTKMEKKIKFVYALTSVEMTPPLNNGKVLSYAICHMRDGSAIRGVVSDESDNMNMYMWIDGAPFFV